MNAIRRRVQTFVDTKVKGKSSEHLAAQKKLKQISASLDLARAVARLPIVDNIRDRKCVAYYAPSKALTMARIQLNRSGALIEQLSEMPLGSAQLQESKRLRTEHGAVTSLTASLEKKTYQRWNEVHAIAQRIREYYSQVTGSTDTPFRTEMGGGGGAEAVADSILMDGNVYIIDPQKMGDPEAHPVFTHTLSELKSFEKAWRTARENCKTPFDVRPAPIEVRHYRDTTEKYYEKGLERPVPPHKRDLVEDILLFVPGAIAASPMVLGSLMLRYMPTRNGGVLEFRKQQSCDERWEKSELAKKVEKAKMYGEMPSIARVVETGRPPNFPIPLDDPYW